MDGDLMIIKRGDIFWADLSPVLGSNEKRRPVMAIQNDIGNRFSPTVIIATITSHIPIDFLPTHVLIKDEKTNLNVDCVVALEQIRTIDKMRLGDKISSVSEDREIMDSISRAYQIAGGVILLEGSSLEMAEKSYLFKINNQLDIIEDLEYEFKEIKGRNPKSAIGNNVAEYATSFLNSSGGRILYGITNDRIVKGFQADANLIDEIQKAIYDSLRTIEPSLSADHYHLDFHPVYENGEQVKDSYVLEVTVPPSNDKKTIYFHKGKELHIRVKGVKHNLKGNEIVTFIQRKLLM